MGKTKLKTHKATAKRFKLTGRKKLLKRAAGQDHFNSRETGVRTMGKRRDVELHHTLDRSVRRMVPANS
jgi:large subunit ribosomal protein L35